MCYFVRENLRHVASLDTAIDEFTDRGLTSTRSLISTGTRYRLS